MEWNIAINCIIRGAAINLVETYIKHYHNRSSGKLKLANCQESTQKFAVG
jgi:hypothetical protein